MIKNVLISGGAGFIGSNLTLALSKRGYSVTILDNLSEQVHGTNAEKSYTFNSIKRSAERFIKGDVRNRKDWEKALVGQDAIIHLASETSSGQSMYQVFKYSQVNIGGTALLLDILTNGHWGIQKIIFASSRAIYGEGRYSCSLHGIVYPHSRTKKDLSKGLFECKCPYCGSSIEHLSSIEDSELNPQSYYAVTKYNQEQLFKCASSSLNIPVVLFRYQNVYGVGQSLSNPYTGILSIFSTQIINNNDINIFEDGKESRDFVYIDDVVTATIFGLECDKEGCNIYNVGTGRALSVLSIASKLISLYRSDVKINITGNFRFGDIRHNLADLTRIYKDLNFTPQYQFEDGITNFVNWVNSQEIEEDNYSLCLNELNKRGLII